jgi:hypothetical protein
MKKLVVLGIFIAIVLNVRPAIANDYELDPNDYELDPLVEQQIIDRLCQMIVQGYTSNQIAEEVVYLMRLNLPAPFVFDYIPGSKNNHLIDPLNELSRSMTRLVETVALQKIYDKAECDF